MNSWRCWKLICPTKRKSPNVKNHCGPKQRTPFLIKLIFFWIKRKAKQPKCYLQYQKERKKNYLWFHDFPRKAKGNTGNMMKKTKRNGLFFSMCALKTNEVSFVQGIEKMFIRWSVNGWLRFHYNAKTNICLVWSEKARALKDNVWWCVFSSSSFSFSVVVALFSFTLSIHATPFSRSAAHHAHKMEPIRFCGFKSLDWIIMHFYEASIKFDLKMKNFNVLIVSSVTVDRQKKLWRPKTVWKFVFNPQWMKMNVSSQNAYECRTTCLKPKKKKKTACKKN